MVISLLILVTSVPLAFFVMMRRRSRPRGVSSNPRGFTWFTEVPKDNDCQRLARLLFDHCNTFRRTHGLPPMTWNDELSVAAFNQSHRMNVTGKVDHVLSDGVTTTERIERTGYVSTTYRENLAWYKARALSVEELANRIHEGWVNSPGHCANLLAPDCDELGIGVVGCRRRGFYSTQNFGKSQGVGGTRTTQPPVQRHAPPVVNAIPFDSKTLHERSQHPWR